MRAIASVFVVLVAGALGIAGCKSNCGRYCEWLTTCWPEVNEDITSYDSCKWEDDDDEVRADCEDECSQAFDKLNDEEKQEADECFECLDEDLGDSCDGDDYLDAIGKECDHKCDDDGAEEFYEEFGDDFQPDLDCD